VALEQSSLLDGEVVEHVCAKFHFVDLAGTLVPPTHQADVAGNGGNGGRISALPSPCRADGRWPMADGRWPMAVPSRLRRFDFDVRTGFAAAQQRMPCHCTARTTSGYRLRPPVGGRVDVSILSVLSLSTRRV
jgi:hypothetical protein